MGYFDKFAAKGVDFMDGRVKGSLDQLAAIEGFYIEDYGTINTKNGECVVFIVKDIPNLFFFGNPILLEIINTVDADGKRDLLLSTVVSVEKRESKTDPTRSYWNWEFNEDN